MHVAMDSSLSGITNGTYAQADEENELLPKPHLTPASILGGTTPEREVVGQLLATQIATAILTRTPAENRLLVLGLGLPKIEKSQEAFFEVIDLVLRCL